MQFACMAQPLRIAVVVGRDEEAAALIARGIQPQSGLAVVFAMPSSRALAKRLRTVAMVPIVDVHRSMRVEPDHIYVVPADRESTLQRTWLSVDAPARRASRDRLLRSLADSFGDDCAAVLLADRGSDGVLGAKRVKEAGGITICQIGVGDDVSELARAASATAIVDLALPAAEIAPRLLALVGGPDPLGAGADDDVALEDIIALLRKRTRLDFHAYRRDVLAARLRRRMHICETPSLDAYRKRLHDDPTELHRLGRELLIRVADFFRDPATFEALARDVVPKLFRGKGSLHSVRVWVPGCETGEEAYSIGMLLSEHAAHLRETPRLQVFGTDLDEEALREARAGIYPEAIVADVSEERLRRFFTHEHDHYRVSGELRDITVFSPQSMPLDPPYSRLDFVACRGVLSRLTDEAQLRAVEIFHAALRPGGLLWLGEGEQPQGPLFAALDAKHDVYERRAAAPQVRPPARHEASAGESVDALHHRLVDAYGSASVLVDEALDVLHVSARASELFKPGPGVLTRHLLQLVHPGLSHGLRSAIYAAREDATRIVTRIVRFEDQGRLRCVEVRVRTIEAGEAPTPTMLVMFEEREDETEATSGFGSLLGELEDELRRTRDELRVTAQQYAKALRATYAGALFLDRELAVQHYTDRVQHLLHIDDSVVGRPLAEVRHRLDANIAQLAKQVLDRGRPIERVLHDGDHRHYHVRIEPEPTEHGVVLTFVDVTELHTSEDTVASALRSADVAVIAHGADADITWGYVHGETMSSAAQLFTEDSADRYAATVQSVFTTGMTGHVDVELSIGGAAKVYEFQIAPIVEETTITGVTSIGVPRRFQ